MAPLPAVTGEQALSAPGRCATCSSPLATDQLFCLSCGTRRRDARIAFRDVLATEAAPVVATPPGGGGWPPNGAMVPAGEGPMGPGRITYVPFLATLALLLFALGIGVWIGRKPVQAVAAPTAAVPTQVVAATTPESTTPVDEAAASDASAKSDTAAKDDSASTESAAPVKDDTSALSSLDKLSPDQYQKQADKLPNEVGTGGTPPPKDNKPAGGGTEAETFN